MQGWVRRRRQAIVKEAVLMGCALRGEPSLLATEVQMGHDPWETLLAGSRAPMGQIEADFRQHGTPSQAMQLGIAYLWLRDYRQAVDHFIRLIDSYPKKFSVYYGFAGVGKWCVGNPREAVKLWHAGLASEYADAAGGVKLPLLLYFASVVLPSAYKREDAELLLKSRIADPRIRYWPGPLAQYVVGNLDKEQLAPSLEGISFEERQGRELLTRFYIAVHEGSCGDWQVQQRSIVPLGVLSSDDCNERSTAYLKKLWQEEFFLARHIAEQ